LFIGRSNFLSSSYYSMSNILRSKSNEFRYFNETKYIPYVKKLDNNPTIVEKIQDFYFEKDLKESYQIYNGNYVKSKFIAEKKIKFTYGFKYIEGGDQYSDFIYYDHYKGFKRLNIQLHGNFIDSEEGGYGVVAVGGHSYSHIKVIDIAKDAAKYEDFDCIRMLTCHSADGGVNSIISNVSRALQKPVKGYVGEVDRYNPVRLSMVNGGSGAINGRLGRSNIVHRYFDTPGLDLYVRKGKTVMAGFEYF